jgi:hypothetical protein
MGTDALLTAQSEADLIAALDVMLADPSVWSGLLAPENAFDLVVLGVRDGSPFSRAMLERINDVVLDARGAVDDLWVRGHALLSDMNVAPDAVIEQFQGNGDRLLRMLAGRLVSADLATAVTDGIRGCICMRALFDAHTDGLPVPAWMVRVLLDGARQGVDATRRMPAILPHPDPDGGSRVEVVPLRRAA